MKFCYIYRQSSRVSQMLKSLHDSKCNKTIKTKSIIILDRVQ